MNADKIAALLAEISKFLPDIEIGIKKIMATGSMSKSQKALEDFHQISESCFSMYQAYLSLKKETT